MAIMSQLIKTVKKTLIPRKNKQSITGNITGFE